MSEPDPKPPNVLPPLNEPNEFVKPNKKFDKSLRAKKTTRTINPDPKNTMKHSSLLKSSQVNVKRVTTRSSSKGDELDLDNEEMKEGRFEEAGMDIKDDVIKEDLVNDEGLGIKEIRGEVRKSMDVGKRLSGSVLNSNVSEMFSELSSVYLSKNNNKNNSSNETVPEIPIPFELNDFEGGKDSSIDSNLSNRSGVNVGMGDNVDKQGWGQDNVHAMKDVEMQDTSNVKKPVSFSRVMQGASFNGNNKLKLVSCAINNEGRKVVDMDSVIEEGSKKWGLTVVGHFVGFKMSYKEIVGHLKRMWRPYQLDEIIVNEGGLYFFKFKSEDGLQNVIENGLWLVDKKPFFCAKVGCRRYGRTSFARVLIEFDVANRIVDKVEIWYRSLNRTMELKVDYAWQPPVCSHCCFFGHSVKACNNRVLTKEEIAEQHEARVDGYNGRRGGYRSRGKGGISGRGMGGSRQMSNEKKYVPVGNNSKVKISVGEELQKQGKDLEEKNSEDRNVKFIDRRNFSTSNRFSTLVDEEEENRMNKWSWTDEMWEFYQGRVAKKRRGRDESGKGIDVEGVIEVEVSRDPSAHAAFMMQNNVSSPVDVAMASSMASFDQVMHFELKIISDKRKFFVYFIYGKFEPKDRLKLWVNLSDHLLFTDNQPWAILGDFNVIMYADEQSKGSIDNYHGVKEFRGCMELLDMEDLAMNGLCYTWVQKMKDPESCIMKKLDKIMGNC
ncbi:RNA-directed DNA polymerase, eukaryota, reverse transcriptase zinc-binding domain protein [Tanacetum coccineum]